MKLEQVYCLSLKAVSEKIKAVGICTNAIHNVDIPRHSRTLQMNKMFHFESAIPKYRPFEVTTN